MKKIVYGIRPIMLFCNRLDIEIKNEEMIIAVYERVRKQGIDYEFNFLFFEDFNGEKIDKYWFNDLNYKHQNLIYLNERFNNKEYLKNDFMESIIFDRVLVFDDKEEAKYLKIMTYQKLKLNLENGLEKISSQINDYDLLPYLI